jgi:hypothetical protein
LPDNYKAMQCDRRAEYPDFLSVLLLNLILFMTAFFNLEDHECKNNVSYSALHESVSDHRD